MFRFSSKVLSLQRKPGLLWNYNIAWNYMSWSPGADAIHAWYMWGPENKDILRFAFELGMSGNAHIFIGQEGFTWVPKAFYNLQQDYWFSVEGTSPVFELYLNNDMQVNRPCSPLRITLIQLIGWNSNNGAIITHILENCPDPDEVLAYNCKYFGNVEDGALLLNLTAIVDAIEDFRRKRDEQEEATSGAKPNRKYITGEERASAIKKRGFFDV